MLRFKRLDRPLTHAVWLFEVEEHDGFTMERRVAYNVFVTKRAADNWLYKQVFHLLDTVKEL